MGGNVSSGQNNDELVDNLIESGLIKTNLVERVFRTVDRGLFYLPKFRSLAYRDLAWREGYIHISAPCIYTRVLESLEVRPNQSFLNIGSGTGYLTCMVGLILGPYGVNHNIELHADLIEYARDRLSEFVRTAAYFDDFDFCMPKFVHGNFLNLAAPATDHDDKDQTDSTMLYDRIYVGAGVSDEHEEFIKSLLKIDGILIMPLNDCLMKIKRINETLYEKNSIMTVSYASLITDSIDPNKKFSMPKLKPLTLQEICRFKIRRTVREAIEKEDPTYYKVKRYMSTYNKSRRLHGRSSSSSQPSASTRSASRRCHSARKTAGTRDGEEENETNNNENGDEKRRRNVDFDHSDEANEDDDGNDDDDYDDDEDEDERDENDMYDEYDLYDSDEDFGTDEEDNVGGSSYAAIARFERIFRPRLGLNISYARFDNHLRLLIGHGRLPASPNSSRPSPQQETPIIEPTQASAAVTANNEEYQTVSSKERYSNKEDDNNDEDDEDELLSDNRNSSDSNNTHDQPQQKSTQRSSITSMTRSRLSWLPILSFRNEDSTTNRSKLIPSPINASTASSAYYSSPSELETALVPSTSKIEEENKEVASIETTNRGGQMCSKSTGSTSESGFSEESSSRLSNSENNDINVNSQRKRNISTGYNSETDPSDTDRHELVSVVETSSIDEKNQPTFHQLASSSSTSMTVAERSTETDAPSSKSETERKGNDSNALALDSSSPDERDLTSTNSEDERQQQQEVGNESKNTSTEKENNNNNDDQDATKKPIKETLKKSKRENFLRKRIMQLPLSPQMKSFLLYNREI